MNKADDSNVSPNDTDTSNSLFEMNEGSVTKSFSSDFENCDEDSLRQKQEPTADKQPIKHFHSDAELVTQ